MTADLPRTLTIAEAERDVEDALLQIVNTTLHPEQGQAIMRLVRRVSEAAARPSDDLTGLDVERLAEAMRRFYIKQPTTFDTTAAAIAAIYERLARLEPGEGET